MTRPLLTKSRFIRALSCPAKLFFLDKPDEYPDAQSDDEFLEALAEGGFQVGELAKCHRPGGVEIEARDPARAVEETEALFAGRDDVVLFEAAFRAGDLFVRADVVEKRGRRVKLVEVKAKSVAPGESPFFAKRGGGLSRDFEPYLFDVAFQTHVLGLAHPGIEVEPFLLLADRTRAATVDGLNQRFFLRRDESGRTRVERRGDVSPAALGQPILSLVGVSEEVEFILSRRDYGLLPRFTGGDLGFADLVRRLAEALRRDERLRVGPGPHCKGCEFRADAGSLAPGERSGFDECWAAIGPGPGGRAPVFDIWDFRRSERVMAEGKRLVEELEESDVEPAFSAPGEGFSRTERQWLQVTKARSGNVEPVVDRAGLRRELAKFTFPLHFVDFETATVAIPFHRGRRPYETIAFQFSHHVVERDGTVAHRGEWLHAERGAFPNFEFVRALRGELDGDGGTIFRFADHENTVLCAIRRQLLETADREVPDRKALVRFIESVTRSTASESPGWAGPREMVDLLDVWLRRQFSPRTGGSNSLKRILPAILAESPRLRAKYARPIYGARGGIRSRNFADWAWVRYDEDGAVVDPYSLLEPVFPEYGDRRVERVFGRERISEGSAAMAAYACLQFVETGEAERERLRTALLRYCELDTLAMVLLHEHWSE